MCFSKYAVAVTNRLLLGVAAQLQWWPKASTLSSHEAQYHTNKMDMHVAMFRKWIMVRIVRMIELSNDIATVKRWPMQSNQS
jgi:hypothetical protein